MTGAGGPPGGTPGQIQFNDGGAFGGFTASGDCTIVPATTLVTCTTLNSRSPGTLFGLNLPSSGPYTYSDGATLLSGSLGNGLTSSPGMIDLTSTIIDCSSGTCPGEAAGVIPASAAATIVKLGAHAYTIADAGTTGFTTGFGLTFINIGATAATVTAPTSVWNGGGGTTVLTVAANVSAGIATDSDNANYVAGLSGGGGGGPGTGTLDAVPYWATTSTLGSTALKFDGTAFSTQMPFDYASISAFGAAIAGVGSGGTDGATVLTVVGGTLAAGGTASTFNATITGGVLDTTAPLTVASAGGPYTVVPSDPVAVTSSDAGPLTGATVNFGSSGWNYAPSVAGSDPTSGFGLRASGLPQLVDGPDGIQFFADNFAGMYRSAGLELSSPINSPVLAITVAEGFSGNGNLSIEATGGNNGGLYFLASEGVRGALLATRNNDVLGALNFQGWNHITNFANSVLIYSSATEDFIDNSHLGAMLHVASASSGNNAVTDRLVIDGNGNTNVENGNLLLNGSSSGAVALAVPAAAGTNTITLPSGTTDFSATGGTSEVVQQTSAGGAFTVGRLACADLSDSAGGCSTAGGTTVLNTSSLIETLPNASSGGTAANKLVIYTTGAQVKTAAVTDTSDIIGICVSGVAGTSCGTTGNASIAIAGQASCVFDGATTAGDFVVASTSVAGDCSDAGATVPVTVAVLGQVLSTNGGGGTYSVDISPIGAMSALNSKAKPGGSNTQVQFNNSGAFGGDANMTKVAGALTLGVSGVAGSVAMGNATSGTVTLQPVTGALGSVTASLPANTGTLAELNLAQTWSAAQTFGQVNGTSRVVTAGSTDTLLGTDCGKQVYYNNAAYTVTIPASIVPASGTVCRIDIITATANKVSVNGTAVSAATLISADSYTGTQAIAGSGISLSLTTIGAATDAFLFGHGS